MNTDRQITRAQSIVQVLLCCLLGLLAGLAFAVDYAADVLPWLR